jgi:integrase
MSNHDWIETVLNDGRIRWSKENATIEKRGERRFWCRVQIGRKGCRYDRTHTFETKAECEVWIENRMSDNESIGLDSLPSQREILELRQLRAVIGDADLQEVAALWKQHQPKKSRTVWEAVDEYLTCRLPEWAVSTRNTNSSKANWLKSQFQKEDLLFDVRKKKLEELLNKLPVNNETRNGYLAFTKAFCNWCIEKGYLKKSPAKKIKKFHVEGRAVKYLRQKQAEAFIRAAEKYDPELVPILVLMLLVGIRPEIVLRMAPKLDQFIDLEDMVIAVPEHLEEGEKVNKTGDYVIESDLPGDVWAWLRAYWDGKPLKVQNFQKRRREIANKAGVVLSHDVLRHTFATFDYAVCRNMDTVAGHLGHSNSATTARYYVNRTAKGKDGRAFFALRPLPGAKPVRRKRVNPHATKADWPSDEMLIAWVEARGKVEVGKKLGVSEAAVRKRLARIRKSLEK